MTRPQPTPGANHKPAVTDRDLVIAYQAGDSAAYHVIYQRHAPRVGRITLRMLGNPHDADEAAQETFLKAFQALPRFNGSYQLGAWLARIASNTCLDQLRARARSGQLEELPGDDKLAEICGMVDPLADEDQRLRNSLLGLPPLHARALMLRTREGLSHMEMAHRLDMSPTQIKALLHRARKSFRSSWNKADGSAHEGQEGRPRAFIPAAR